MNRKTRDDCAAAIDLVCHHEISSYIDDNGKRKYGHIERYYDTDKNLIAHFIVDEEMSRTLAENTAKKFGLSLPKGIYYVATSGKDLDKAIAKKKKELRKNRCKKIIADLKEKIGG